MRVCLGGTFNIFHKGHKHLIDTAFKFAGKNGFVFIGISEGDLIHKKKFITPYPLRIKAIQKYLNTKEYTTQASITAITTKYGLAVDGDFDAIIVSPDTRDNAIEINKKRHSLGKKPLEIVKISHILADDNKPISSTRIYNKQIDREGRIISSC